MKAKTERGSTMRVTIILAVIVVIEMVALVYFFGQISDEQLERKQAEPQQSELRATALPVDKPKDEDWEFIKGKLCPVPVSKDLLPVVILRCSTERYENGMVSKYAHVAGMGTLVKTAKGPWQLLTAEHVFSALYKSNEVNTRYAVKVLRDDPGNIAGYVALAGPFYSGKVGLVDLAHCLVTKNGDDVTPFSPHGVGVIDREAAGELMLCDAKPEDLILQSLVSGEEVKILAMSDIPGTNRAETSLRYYLVDCQSRPGESGTGFVDRCGDLYVLKGPMIDGVEGANKLFKSRGLINEERESFTFVIGPVTLATKTTGAVQ